MKELASALAKKLGISEEDAAIALSLLALDQVDSTEKTIGLIGSAGEALSKTNSQQVQQALAPAVGYALLKQMSTDPFQQRLLSLISALTTLKALSSDQGMQQLINSITEQLKELNTRIQRIEEGKKVEEVEKIAETVNSLAQELIDLKKRFEGGQTQVSTQNTTISTIKDELKEFTDTINTISDILKALGYEVRKPWESKELTPEELAKIAERWGLEVKRKGLTPDEVRRMLEEERRKVWEEAEKTLQIKEKELALKREFMDRITQILSIGFREIIGPIIKKQLGAVAEEELSRALDKRVKEIVGGLEKSETVASGT